MWGAAMPLKVDRDATRTDILMALQRCVEDKPIESITLRDVAAKAGMSHTKLLYYFENRDDLLVSYVRLTRDSLSSWCEEWFAKHSLGEYASKRAFLDDFLSSAYARNMNANRANATIQTYVLAHYDEAVARMLHSEYRSWHETMGRCLEKAFGEPVDPRLTEVMMIVASGIFICNYNEAPTSHVASGLLDCLTDL